MRASLNGNTGLVSVLWIAVEVATFTPAVVFAQPERESVTWNRKDDGYRGIWYMNQPSGDEYVFKYSGGLGTYCAKHRPFAIYRPEVNRTFFCYGGAAPGNDRRLWHMVSCFDHATGTVPRPTVVLDKRTDDAHDNPVLTIDGEGYLWLFSTSHGRSRPSYVHRSVRPYDIEEFERVAATRWDGGRQVPMDNFSYLQAWYQAPHGHAVFFTRYRYPAARTICFMSSRDGASWSRWQRLAAIEEGHYQVSGQGRARLGTLFNVHPAGKGLNWRTNLYYLETTDRGESWQTAGGQPVDVPLRESSNPALVRNYAAEGRLVYLKDLQYDEHDRPVLLYLTSGGYQSGPRNAPRIWTIACWTGEQWRYHEITESDNNYDMGELHLRAPDDWRLIAPTATGPQPFNPGGEIEEWISVDRGRTWKKERVLTAGSPRNHTYVRRTLNAHPDFVAFWADGHGREPSQSTLYFSNAEGAVYALPREMDSDSARPARIDPWR